MSPHLLLLLLLAPATPINILDKLARIKDSLLDKVWTSASKSSIRMFVIRGLLLVESGYYRFHI